MPTKGYIPLLSDAELTLLPWREVPSLPGIRDDLVASCNDPDMVRWTTIPNPYTGEHADDFLLDPPEGVHRWAYVVDGRYCGNIEMRPGGVLGYNTAPWARGQGLTARALRLVATHAYTQGLRRLELHIVVDNAASRRTAEKAGYTFDGLLPDPVRLRGHEDALARYVLPAPDEAEPNSTSIAP
ncbi:GNAT family N-acetyltransferase [Corynebacterium afermentans subsp. lipophilum]|uniref:GNAT family N-acetyltransferase n=1 Tax=Corynebacterium afermentans TaxID=38286 RepID=UPI00188A7B19|nr:GNAT family protein [Corynebacterium afermentans]MBF4547662.1 GNAT family N-acetyltransferase [Corynebacterium afermentans subsp. lipophilum]WJY58624.1 Acetyltransferase (GNAT) family protein [Corynebacterium afermentans subsp. lipophilum]